MITIKKLHKYFNRHRSNELHVINDVSVSFEKKGLVAFLGPSGSGKTTMLNLLGLLDKQSKGDIYIYDEKVSKHISRKRDKLRTLKIGYIFQDYKLIDEESVFDNVAFSLKLIGVKNKKVIKEKVEYALEKLDLLRYKYRPCAMLSGGERQRVGIARAIVKDPDIILADEPTGNLDSKNTIEVMNIISQISKEKLVILVTHEQNLAKFYANRIIEFNDGIIKKDYENEHPDDLDYQIENKFYLKDFKYKESIGKNSNINIYSNDNSKIRLDIVVKNGNYYIKAYENNLTEVIDDDSKIEFIDDSYKKINKEDLNNNSFNLDRINQKKYSSIFNIFTIFKRGFQKVFNYSFFKKILLVGFFISSGFVLYAVSSYTASIRTLDEEFISNSKNYYEVTSGKNKVKKYNSIKNINPDYIYIPGDVEISMNFINQDLYQFMDQEIKLSGALAPIDELKDKDILYGRLPQNKNEVVLDILTVKRNFDNIDAFENQGLTKVKDILGYQLNMPLFDNYTIVGISNKNDYSIYVDKDDIIPLVILNNYNKEGFINLNYVDEENPIFINYDTCKDDIKIVKGRKPNNDYEIIVNYRNRYDYPLKKNVSYKINKKKVKVVGYYETSKDISIFITNNNTYIYNYLKNTNNILVYASGISKKNVIEEFNNNNLKIENTYDLDKKIYKDSKKESVDTSKIVAIVIISISLIESYLISRSSFLSKIKDVGIYRAIGVKKTDIYKMFIGEVFAITTIASLSGIILTSYILEKMSHLSAFKYSFVINFNVVLISIIFVYIFNIISSLIPVFMLIRKEPARILSRNDVD